SKDFIQDRSGKFCHRGCKKIKRNDRSGSGSLSVCSKKDSVKSESAFSNKDICARDISASAGRACYYAMIAGCCSSLLCLGLAGVYYAASVMLESREW
nr:hypothetical protein [Endozoicomonas sp.]